MNLRNVRSCFISLSVTYGTQKLHEQDIIFQDLSPVRVKGNKVLIAILEAYDIWDRSPLIWIDNFPYKIKILKQTESYVDLLQMPVRIEYKNNGKECYTIISKRMVRIVFV